MATKPRKSKADALQAAFSPAKPLAVTQPTPPKQPDGALMLKSAEGMLAIAQSFIIDSPIMYEAAAEELKAIKAKAKALDEERKGITREFDALKKRVMELFKPALSRLEMAEACIKEAMTHWDDEQRRQAAKAQRILDEHAAKERERAEQLAREKVAEAAEADRMAAELAQSGDVEGAAKAKEVAAAAAMVANTLQATVYVISAPTVQANTANVEGIRHTSTWKATVTNKAALVRHIAAECERHPELLDWVDFNMGYLHEMARALKTATQIPGVTVAEETGIAAAAKAA